MDIIKRNIHTAKNYGDSTDKEILELLMLINAIGVLSIVAPAVYYVTNDSIIPLIVVAFGIIDFVLSQYFPQKVTG